MHRETKTDAHGNQVEHSFFLERERYHYDLLRGDWQQWDTDQDAPYFGVWVNPEALQIICFAEGDEYRTTCPTREAFIAAIERLEQFHGTARAGERLTSEQLRNPAVTIYQIFESRWKAGGREPKTDGYTMGDFENTGLAMLGGCHGCGESLAAYNAYPDAATDHWACKGCLRKPFPTVDAFDRHYDDAVETLDQERQEQ